MKHQFLHSVMPAPHRKYLLSVLFLVLCSSFIIHHSSFSADVPSIINYQGRLADNLGAPLAGGFYRIQFRIWDHPTATGAGDLIWGREFPLHVMTGGVFNILLSDDGGILTPAPEVNYLRDAFADQDRYLGLTITRTPGGDVVSPSEISPRQHLVSAPYAFAAGEAHSAPNGFDVYGVLGLRVAGGATVNGGLVLTNGNLALRGNWVSHDGASRGLTLDSQGQVGIGTNIPAAALDVAGRIRDKTGWVMPVGTVLPFAGTTVPDGWLECNGAVVSRTTYAELYGVIGITYGAGSSPTTFTLPDLRGRVPLGAGQGTGLTSRTQGALLGEEGHTLTTGEMPYHAHSYTRYASQESFFGHGAYGGMLRDTSEQTSGYAGGNQAHNNMQPGLVLKYIIKY